MQPVSPRVASSKKIMPVMYCILSCFAGARFSLNKRCARSSLSGTPLATRGPYLRATRFGWSAKQDASLLVPWGEVYGWGAPVSPRGRYQHSLIGRFCAQIRLAAQQQDSASCWLAITEGLNQALFWADFLFWRKLLRVSRLPHFRGVAASDQRALRSFVHRHISLILTPLRSGLPTNCAHC